MKSGLLVLISFGISGIVFWMGRNAPITAETIAIDSVLALVNLVICIWSIRESAAAIKRERER